MAPHDEDDDPAVYHSGSHKKPSASGSNGLPTHFKDVVTQVANGSPAEQQMDDDSEGEDDSTLLAVQPGFNRLLLVLRDEGVMHFVKYVSAAADGSRWDICGEYEIGVLQEDEDT